MQEKHFGHAQNQSIWQMYDSLLYIPSQIILQSK